MGDELSNYDQRDSDLAVMREWYEAELTSERSLRLAAESRAEQAEREAALFANRSATMRGMSEHFKKQLAASEQKRQELERELERTETGGKLRALQVFETRLAAAGEAMSPGAVNLLREYQMELRPALSPPPQSDRAATEQAARCFQCGLSWETECRCPLPDPMCDPQGYADHIARDRRRNAGLHGAGASDQSDRARHIADLRPSYPLSIDAVGAGSWSLRDALSKLCEAADHLLRDHSCDVHGYEEIGAATRAGREYLVQSDRAEASGATSLGSGSAGAAVGNEAGTVAPVQWPPAKPDLDSSGASGAVCTCEFGGPVDVCKLHPRGDFGTGRSNPPAEASGAECDYCGGTDRYLVDRGGWREALPCPVDCTGRSKQSGESKP